MAIVSTDRQFIFCGNPLALKFTSGVLYTNPPRTAANSEEHIFAYFVDLQVIHEQPETRANEWNLTRNEQVGGSSPLVGFLFCLFCRRPPSRSIGQQADSLTAGYCGRAHRPEHLQHFSEC